VAPGPSPALRDTRELTMPSTSRGGEEVDVVDRVGMVPSGALGAEADARAP
jgi:hypothetical protein